MIMVSIGIGPLLGAGNRRLPKFRNRRNPPLRRVAHMANRKSNRTRAINHSMLDHNDHTTAQKITRKQRMRMEQERTNLHTMQDAFAKLGWQMDKGGDED